eukprot:COSAG01_NODE_4135_length_5315_cov_134.343750_3_plen_100_part_00
MFVSRPGAEVRKYRVDVSRAPPQAGRYGVVWLRRVCALSGECPLLTSTFIQRVASGMQSGEDARYLQAICSPKHFLACECAAAAANFGPWRVRMILLCE